MLPQHVSSTSDDGLLVPDQVLINTLPACTGSDLSASWLICQGSSSKQTEVMAGTRNGIW